MACDQVNPNRTPRPKDIHGFPPGTELAAMEACETQGGLEHYSQGEHFTTTVENGVRKVKVHVKCKNQTTIIMFVPVPKD